MACYVCGNSGHKRNKCPERISKIKCYECDSLGHYKNDCPITKEKIRNERLLKEQEELLQKQKLLLQQKIDDDKWFDSNVLPSILVNDSEIKNVLTNTLASVCYLKTLKGENLVIYIDKDNDQLKCYDDTPLGRFLRNISVDDFILFSSKWRIFSEISYDITNGLSGMIYKLKDANIAKKIETEKDREVEYKLCNKKVMYSRRHSTDWRSHVHKEYQNLILDEYSKYIDGVKYEDNICKFKGQINFMYK